MDLEHIIGFDALFQSMRKCRRNVAYKESVSRFCDNDIEEILRLEAALKTGSYRQGRVKIVHITHPKPREALAITFRDRVYQRSLNDNELYPTMVKSFCRENMACQHGKGPELAMDMLDEQMRHHYRLHGLSGGILQADIKGYYKNMRHDRVEAMFDAKFAPEVFDMTLPVLRRQESGETGYYPGSQMIQIAGISTPSGIDHHVKERVRPEGYVRYQDDMLAIDNEMDKLARCRDDIGRLLNAEGLTLHPLKTRIVPFADGVMFLGFRHRVTDTGKVLRLIDSGNVKNARKRLYRQVQLAKAGTITKHEVDECFSAWVAHAEKGNCNKVIERMRAYYKNLWRDKNVS